MTMLEVLQKRKEVYEGNLKKTCYSAEEKRDIQCRISEIDNLLFIIGTQEIKGIK